MRVTKAQAQANRAHIIETASVLFRERGYDGVGVADLMAAAGFTHGGFYKHFSSKADLMAQAAECGMAQTLEQTAGVDAADFFERYVSRAHRDARGTGCTLAALCGDAARQPDDVKAVFAEGVERLLSLVAQVDDGSASDESQQQNRVRAINQLAMAVGAIVLSRACPDDSALAEELLQACR